ncbi:MAG: hypothetical protein FWC70_10800 [Defluviitaleaceae bacterium]|nr:hypothetical protein [Defluviitaleaceae bacterium]
MKYWEVSTCLYCGLETTVEIEETPRLGLTSGSERITCASGADGGCGGTYVLEYAISVVIASAAVKIEGVAKRLAAKQKQAAHVGERS